MLRATPLLIIALLLAACGAPASQSPANSTDEFAPTEQARTLGLPFDAYSFSDAQMYLISNAEDVIIRDCMSHQGYHWKVIQRPTDIADLRNRRRYGVIEIKIARFGYHVPTGLLTPANVEQEYDARDATLSDKEKNLAYGPEGCGPKAAAQLQQTDNSPQNQLLQRSRTSLYDSEKDPGVSHALKTWRDCMHQTGLEYQDPLAAMADPKWWADDTAGPSNKEIAVAVADVTCKDASHLVDAWHAAEVRFQDKAIKQDPNFFQRLRAELTTSLDAANAVLARP